MTNLRTAAQQALEALEGKRYTACGWRADCDKAITALRSALAEPEPPPEAQTEAEKMAYCAGWWDALEKARNAIDASKQKPLTDEEISNIWDGHVVPVFGKNGINPIVFARAVERAHGIGGQL